MAMKLGETVVVDDRVLDRPPLEEKQWAKQKRK